MSHVTVFLNLDGVLHFPAARLDSLGGTPYMAAARHQLWEWSPVLIDVVGRFEIDLVLRTSWTYHLGWEKTRDFMPRQLGRYVIGETEPILELTSFGLLQVMTRYESIAQYVIRHKLEKWLAIDDVDDGWPEAKRERLILCDSKQGLSNARTQLELVKSVEATAPPT